MVFFLAIMALSAVTLLLVRAMDIEGVNRPFASRATRIKAQHAKTQHATASVPLDSAALRGLY